MDGIPHEVYTEGAKIWKRKSENSTVKKEISDIINKKKTMDKKELDNILALHKLWLRGDAKGKSADLAGVDLSDANLIGAKLIGANLSKANLSKADLSEADLREANLYEANLSGADLSEANLYEANLDGANLSGTYLNGANFRDAKNIPYIPMACPSAGSFIGWKKVNKRYLVKLLIPEDAKRSSATTNKCRCDKAEVVAITDLEGKNPVDMVVNFNYFVTTYKVNEMVYPDSFDEDRWNECSHGIHFFINKQDAIDY